MIFVYTAKDKKGEEREGTVEATSVEHAARILRSRNLIPLEIHRKEGFSLSSLLRRWRGVSEEEKTIFTRQLATMVAAGLPLARALEVLVVQARNPRFKEVLLGCLHDVQAGASLSSSLAKEGVFSPVYISLLKAGEASGALDRILLRLAETKEKQRRLSRKVKGALIYPAIVVAGVIVVFIIMMVFVIPKLVGIYEDVGAQLPLPTRIMIGLSDLVNAYWWAGLLLFGLLSLAVWYLRRSDYGRYELASLTLRLPVFGHIVRQSQLAELSRTLALLVSSGVPILQSLDIVRGAVSNILYGEAIERAAVLVEKGAPLSAAFKNDPLFPPAVGQMVGVGEETGKVDEVLFKIAQIFEDEVDQTVKNLTTAMEPLIIVLLGVMVGFLILSVILPIYSLTSQL